MTDDVYNALAPLVREALREVVREAARNERLRLRVAVEGMTAWIVGDARWNTSATKCVERDAILALLTEAHK